MSSSHPHRPGSRRGPTLRTVVLAAVTLVVAALVAPVALVAPAAAGPVPTGPTPAAGGGAAITVGNGLSTTDLTAVGATPSGLASSLVGPGVTVSNVTYTGAPTQAGTIHLVDPAVVSFNDGVILSSGHVADVVGPNKSEGTTGDLQNPGDADLTSLIAASQTVDPNTYDAASLEFDFVPTASQVYFTYTFGSDEYLEWVNLFNDVFAFYVNGQNCAVTPSGDPVSIDTINSTVNSSLYRDNSYASPPANPINIEPDGLSVELICSAPVTPNATNHLKLAIADTSDHILDSVVMIKAHSLSTTPPESCNDGIDNDDDTKVDQADDQCATSTTPPPTTTGGGVGSGGNNPPFTGNEGSPILLDASAAGWTATPDTVSTTWTVTGINGTVGTCDVSPSTPQPVGPGGAIAVVTATCPNEGEYVARVDGLDIEGSSSFDKDVDFFVHNAPPAVAIGSPAMGDHVAFGTTASLVADVTDPGAADPVTCSIDWGDGTTEAGTVDAGQCLGSHDYGNEGDYLVAVTATDDAGDSGAAAALVSVDPAGATTTLDLTSSAGSTVAGQAIVLRATATADPATGVPTGAVSFYDGATLVATKALAKGTAAITVRPTSSRTYTAVYDGDALHLGATSPGLDQVVVDAETATTLAPMPEPSVTGQRVALRAVVKAIAPGAGNPTGTVSFYEDATLLATKALSNGSAVLWSSPTSGRSYTAVYDGASGYQPSSSTVVAHDVLAADTTTVLTANANPSVTGQAVTLRAAVKAKAPGSGVPTGSVSFYEDGALVATKALTNGAAALALRPTAGHTYTATYEGSSAYVGSTSAGLVHAVAPAATKVVLRTSAASATTGTTGGLTATVSALSPGSGTPTGTVVFTDGSTVVGVAVLTAGTAKLPFSALGVGDHAIVATYLGTAGYGASASTPVAQRIT